jgi:hypothetical protein
MMVYISEQILLFVFIVYKFEAAPQNACPSVCPRYCRLFLRLICS